MILAEFQVLDFALIGLITTLAGMGQAAVGFGYALFATPLLLYIGVPLPYSILLISTCSLYQSLIGSWKLREHIPWKITFWALPVRFATMLIGLYMLEKLVTFPVEQIRSAIGLVICCLVLLQILYKPRPAESIHWFWGVISFSGSGIVAGLAGMGGPPIVLWVLAHNWNSKKMRGFLFSIFATSIPLQIIVMGFQFEEIVSEALWMSVICIPSVILGTALGIPIGNRLEKEKLKIWAYGILFIIGLSSMFPMLKNFFSSLS